MDKKLIILIESLTKLTGKRVILENNSEISDLIKQGKATKSYTHVNNSDFEIKYDDMDSYLILLWINVKPGGKYKGLDIFKALVDYSKQRGLELITAYAAKGKFYKIETNGFYTLIKWGFETNNIDEINKILGTSYESFEAARNDSSFLPMWKAKGKDVDVKFNLAPSSLSIKTLEKL